MAFIQKTVHAEDAFGADLCDLRKRRGLSIEEASELMKIVPSVLRAWEEGNWTEVDDVRYAERMLRAYVVFLGGPEQFYVEKMHAAFVSSGVTGRTAARLPNPQRIPRFDLAIGARLRTAAIALLCVGVLMGYMIVQVRNMSVPPSLTLTQPEDGKRLDGPRVIIEGQTIGGASVTVNSRGVIVQSNGSFSTELNVPRGTTLITVQAKKRYSREVEITRRVIFDHP